MLIKNRCKSVSEKINGISKLWTWVSGTSRVIYMCIQVFARIDSSTKDHQLAALAYATKPALKTLIAKPTYTWNIDFFVKTHKHLSWK